MLTPGSRFPSKFYSPSILYSARVVLVHIEGVECHFTRIIPHESLHLSIPVAP